MTPRVLQATVIAAASTVLLTLPACRRAAAGPPSDPLMEVFKRQAEEEGFTRTQTEGKRLFVQYCATCHGERGEGDGQNAFNLDPKPPNFLQSLKTHPPSYWRQIVEGGTAAVGRSPLCPPWGRNLTATQVGSLVAYLEVLSASAKSKAAAQATPDR